MGKKLTKAVANWLLYDDMETGELNEIYMYGVGQLGINIFNMLTALTIGFLFGELLVSVVYIISFVFLRSYAGGYHASTPMRCYALTVASIILVLLTVKYVSLRVFCLLLLFIMSSIVILLLAPIDTINKRLDEIEEIHALYSPVKLGLAAALACCGFTFLLGGGPIEMALAFIAAGIGNLIRTKLIKHHYTLFLNIAVSVSAACFTYAVFLKLAELVFHIPEFHEAGYICSMLFIIPGFPFITSGIDLAKLDLRSGLERLTYAIIIVMVATLFAWIMALLLHLEPADFTALHLSAAARLIFRVIASFCGVFGFSIMFNSSHSMAATAAFIGAIANTLRLELVDFTHMPPAAAAFIGALIAGLLASFIKKSNGYPRISLTVPSIVIMVPGLYLYRAIYNFGIMSLTDAVSWFTSAIMIIVMLPLGLIFARILTDHTFRYCT